MKVFAAIVHYAARSLAFLLAFLLSLFILEGLDPAYGWQSGVGHALFAAVAFALAWLAHKKPKIGGSLYIILGLGMLAGMLWTSPMAKAGPTQLLQLLTTMNPMVIFLCTPGILFLLDAWLSRPPNPQA